MLLHEPGRPRLKDNPARVVRTGLSLLGALNNDLRVGTVCRTRWFDVCCWIAVMSRGPQQIASSPAMTVKHRYATILHPESNAFLTGLHSVHDVCKPLFSIYLHLSRRRLSTGLTA